MKLSFRKEHNNKPVIYLAAILAVFIIILLSIYVFIPTKKDNKTDIPPVATVNYLSITQKIYLSKTKIRTNNISINAGATALEALSQTAKIEKKGEGKNAFVIAIENIKVSEAKKQFWAFYINGKTATVGAGSYILKNKDVIEWKIEKY